MLGRNREKTMQMLSNTMRLNFCNLKIIHILHPRYHPKLIGRTLKVTKRTNLSVFMRLYD